MRFGYTRVSTVAQTLHQQHDADPEARTDHTIGVGILSRVVLTQPKQISAFPDKLRAIQQGDGQDDDIKTMGRPALHVGVHLGGPPGYETGFQDNIRGR